MSSNYTLAIFNEMTKTPQLCEKGRFSIFGWGRDRLARRNGMDFKLFYVTGEMAITPIAVGF